MSFPFERRARSRKAGGRRSWFGKPPDARELAERLRRLVPRIWKGVAVTGSDGQLRVELHAFAPALRLGVTPDAEVVLAGDAGMVGPGLCDEAMAQLAPVLGELELAWDDEPRDGSAEILGQLARELAAGATRIAMPEGRTFFVDAPIQTAMGPRDAAWRDAACADPRAGADAFAWTERGPGQLERSRALLAMWHEVPWRAPIDPEERELMERVDADLRAARAADGELALPYAEWAELVRHLGDAERAARLAARATGPAVIGYRRFDMAVEVGDGWSLTVPGAFVGAWDEDTDRYWATDGDRVVELTRFDTTEHDSAQLIDVAPPLHPVIDQLVDGGRRGRAEAHTRDGVRVVYGIVAAAPHVAIVTCKTTPGDDAWALATWRSLRHA